MNTFKQNLLSAFTFACVAIGAVVMPASDARAEIVNVTINGEVEWNFITAPPLGGALVGQAAQLTFTVDSNNFQNNPQFPTRGYPIDKASFKLAFPTTEIGLKDPYPAGQTPYFVIRNNDPAVDGFMVSSGTGFPEGVPLNQAGSFGNFGNVFYATYEGSRLPSLNVLDALRYLQLHGPERLPLGVEDGPVDAMGILFSDMTISVVPEPGSAVAVAVASGLLAMRRRRVNANEMKCRWVGRLPPFSPAQRFF